MSKPLPTWIKRGWREYDQLTVEYQRTIRYWTSIYNASVVWVKPGEITKWYTDANRKTALTGVKHVVDHIVPLNHPYVCGLHCPDNFQIITDQENAQKSNRYWPDMWMEQQSLFDVGLQPQQLSLVIS